MPACFCCGQDCGAGVCLWCVCACRGFYLATHVRSRPGVQAEHASPRLSTRAALRPDSSCMPSACLATSSGEYSGGPSIGTEHPPLPFPPRISGVLHSMSLVPRCEPQQMPLAASSHKPWLALTASPPAVCLPLAICFPCCQHLLLCHLLPASSSMSSSCQGPIQHHSAALLWSSRIS